MALSAQHALEGGAEAAVHPSALVAVAAVVWEAAVVEGVVVAADVAAGLVAY